MIAIDLNADLGEGCPWDDPLLERVSSASISCGAHAGDPLAIRSTLLAAKARGVVVGAHPGYRDREGFGRREQAISEGDVTELVATQLRFLAWLAAGDGVPIRFVKPHGALYNQAQRDPAIARGVIAATLQATTLELPAVLGLPGSEMAKAAAECGVPYIPEGFADRGYREDGQLIPRGESGALLTDRDRIAEQVIRLCQSGTVRTLCLHGDSPGSVALADLVLETCRANGIAVRGFPS